MSQKGLFYMNSTDPEIEPYMSQQLEENIMFRLYFIVLFLYINKHCIFTNYLDSNFHFNCQLFMLPEDCRTLEARNAIFYELIGHDGHGYCHTYGRTTCGRRRDSNRVPGLGVRARFHSRQTSSLKNLNSRC
ncbi:hypothetical protein CsSME_00023762 [Camellia sinensis var. sinensis]